MSPQALPHWRRLSSTSTRPSNVNDDAYDAKQKRVTALMDKSLPELQKILEDATKLKLIELIENLEPNISKLVSDNLRNIVGSALGFETKWSQWEVKSESPITRAIGELAMAQIKLVFPDFMVKMLADKDFQSKLDVAITRHYDYQFKRKISERVETWMSEEAQRQSTAIIEQLKPPEGKK